jgi:hypothetical protein
MSRPFICSAFSGTLESSGELDRLKFPFIENDDDDHNNNNNKKLKTKTQWLLVRKQTISTERPPLVGEVSANFYG